MRLAKTCCNVNGLDKCQVRRYDGPLHLMQIMFANA